MIFYFFLLCMFWRDVDHLENIRIGGAAVAAIAAAAISAGATVYGAEQNKKAGEASAANQQAYNKATQLKEKEARKLYDGFIKDWKKRQEDMGDDFTLQQFIREQVEVSNDPQLRDAYYSVRQEDWNMAQQFADEATDQNMSAFTRLLDNVSGGDYQQLVRARNEAVLGADVRSMYERSRELQAPSILAGSAQRGDDTTFQRADRQEYQIAQETTERFDEMRFNRARAAIEDDRVAAQRQQERALSFLPAIDYLGYANTSVINPAQSAKLQLGMSELNFYANMAAQSMGTAFSSPQPPPAIATNPGDALVKAGVEGTTASIASLAKMYQDSQAKTGGGSTGTSVPSSNVQTTPSYSGSDTVTPIYSGTSAKNP